jgi:hypothetical protein
MSDAVTLSITSAATLEALTRVHGVFNLLESLVWFGAAVVVAVRYRGLSDSSRSMARIAIVGLVAFGISDVWEIFTGSWFQPLGLLILNAVCVLTLVPCLVYCWRHQWPDGGNKAG